MFFLAALILLGEPDAAAPRPAHTLPRLPDYPGHSDDPEPEPAVSANCTVPRPRRDERIIFLRFDHGAAVPDHSVVGPTEETTTGTIEIGSGPGDIFLVLTAYRPMIFRLSGEIRRINRVVVLSPKGAGITGITAAKVSFGTGRNCADGAVLAPASSATLRSLLGRRADAIGEQEEVFRWVVGARGAGKGVAAPHFHNAADATYLEERLNLAYPGGAVRIDPKLLVSSGDAERYSILPNEAGAVQLEQAGAIVKATDQQVAEWEKKARVRHGDRVVDAIDIREVYRVTRPITIPPGCSFTTFLAPSPHHVGGTPCHNNIVTTDGRIEHWAGQLRTSYPELRTKP